MVRSKIDAEDFILVDIWIKIPKPSNLYFIHFFLIQKLRQVVKEQHEAKKVQHELSSEILALHNQLMIKDQEVIALETQNQKLNDEVREIQIQLATMTTKEKMSQPPNAGNNTVEWQVILCACINLIYSAYF